MKRLREFNPTPLDSRANYMGDTSRDHWFIGPVSHTRDSECLDESNWDTAVTELSADNTPGCEIHRFGHWGPGWYELILIHPWRKDLITIAESIESSLANYPVLNDEDFSRREMEEVTEDWDVWASHDFLQLVSEYLDLAWDCFEDIDSDNKALSKLFWDLCSHIGEYPTPNNWSGPLEGCSKSVALADLILIHGFKIPLEDWNELPHEIYHAIMNKQLEIKATDEFGNTLIVPDFIRVQYDVNRLQLISKLS